MFARESDTPPELIVNISGSLPNQMPEAVASVVPDSGNAPLTVNFSAIESTDRDGSIINYAWDFGDGSTGSGETVSHTYNEIGQYNATLTVTDNEGATASTSILVLATDPNEETLRLVPVDDANNRVELGDTLVVSRWEHAFFRFDVSNINGAVANATFRVYYHGERAPLNLYLGGVANDDWTEASGTPGINYSLHSDLSQQLGSLTATEAGYIEFIVTDYVAAQMATDGFVSLELGSDNGGWDRLFARESDTPPELVIETLTDGVVASSISGQVNNAIDSAPMAGVTVVLSSVGDVVAETLSDVFGSYTFAELPVASDYSIVFSIEGYLPQTYRSIETSSDSTTYLETVLQIDENYAGAGTAAGSITDALNGTGIAAVSLSFREGMNTTTGDIIGSVITDASGSYEITTLSAGSYTAEATVEGYQTGYFTVVVVGGISREQQNATLTPLLSVDNVRIVLTWDENPRDLDSHLTGPIPESDSRFHVYYGNSNTQYSNLDVDDTSSFGPETITITQQSDGVYRYSIHDYTNGGATVSESLSLSGARVQVFGDTGLLAEFNVPNQPGTLWTVFELTGNQIVPVNSMTYESRPGDVRSANAVRTDASLIRNLPAKNTNTSGGGGSMGWIGLLVLGLVARIAHRKRSLA